MVTAGLIVGVPALNGARAPAAHAVSDNEDGTITITVNRLDDPEGLERELAAHGITADVSFLPPGKMCQYEPERFEREPDETGEVWIGIGQGEEQLRVLPDDAAGKTLVIEGQNAGWGVQQYHFLQYVVDGPVAPCVPVDPPA